MARTFNHERAAAALADSTLMGDRAAAAKHHVSIRSLQEWRSRLGDDRILVEFLAHKKAAQDAAWASEIPAAIASGIQFLSRAAEQLDASDPAAVHAVAGFVKVLSEIALTREILATRFEEIK